MDAPAFVARGTTHFGAHPPTDARPPKALQPCQVLAVATRPGSILPECRTCTVQLICNARQRANYQMGMYVFSFMRPECEAALGGKVAYSDLLAQRPHTLCELQRLTGKTLATLWRELQRLHADGVNIVAFGPHQEALYGYGPSCLAQYRDNSQRILRLLEQQGPLTVAAIGDYTKLNHSTIRRLLHGLQKHVAGPQVYISGRTKFRVPSGRLHCAPLWARRVGSSEGDCCAGAGG